MSKPELPASKMASPGTPIWVLDTNVLLDWLIFDDPRVASLAAAIEAGRVRLATRTDCRNELVRVLAYPALRADALQLERALASYDRSHRPVDGLAARPGSKPFEMLPRCSDADDQKFLELALEAGAQWLVTKDKALLKLAKALKRLGLFEVLTPEQAALRVTPAPGLPESSAAVASA